MKNARVVVVALAGLGFTVGCTSTTSGGSTSSSSGASGNASSSGMMGGCTETVPNSGRDPTADATLEGGAEAPDFTCYMTAQPLGPSRTVRAHGCVTIFGVGNVVKPGMRLAIFGINQNPGMDTPMYGTSDIMVDAASGCESQGTWRAMNLPTNTPLVFKSFDTETGLNKTAVDTYQYNVVLRADRHDRDNDGDFEFEANMVFVGTYTSIPALAGRTIVGGTNITDGIGRAAMAGEFRDCQERSVGGATMFGSCVDQSAKLTYFNGAEDPQPDITRTATQTDGLFAIVNIKASRENPAGGADLRGQRMEMEGKVRFGGQLYSAGKAQVWTFPDSVTIYSPQGLLPTTDPVGSSSSGGVSSSAAGSSSAVVGSSSAVGSSSIAGSSSAGGTSAVGSSSAAGSSVGASSAVGSSSAPASSAAGSSSVGTGSSVAGSGGSSVGQSSSL